MSANFRRQDVKVNGPKLTRLIPIAARVSSGTAFGFAKAFPKNSAVSRGFEDDSRSGCEISGNADEMAVHAVDREPVVSQN